MDRNKTSVIHVDNEQASIPLNSCQALVKKSCRLWLHESKKHSFVGSVFWCFRYQRSLFFVKEEGLDPRFREDDREGEDNDYFMGKSPIR